MPTTLPGRGTGGPTRCPPISATGSLAGRHLPGQRGRAATGQTGEEAAVDVRGHPGEVVRGTVLAQHDRAFGARRADTEKLHPIPTS